MFYRHGDVLLKKVNEVKGKKKAAARRVTVAYGEATGHHHDVYSEFPVVLYDDAGVGYIDVPKGGNIHHHEHDNMVIEPGMYQIIIERERDPFSETIRTVMD